MNEDFEDLDDDVVYESLKITERGRAAIETVVQRFTEGANIEEIALELGLQPEDIQVLMALDYLTS